MSFQHAGSLNPPVNNVCDSRSLRAHCIAFFGETGKTKLRANVDKEKQHQSLVYVMMSRRGRHKAEGRVQIRGSTSRGGVTLYFVSGEQETKKEYLPHSKTYYELNVFVGLLAVSLRTRFLVFHTFNLHVCLKI